MSHLLAVTQDQPFFASQSGVYILIGIAGLLLICIGMAYGIAFLSYHHVANEREIKRLIKEAIEESKSDG